VRESTHLPSIHCIRKPFIRLNKMLHCFMDFTEESKIKVVKVKTRR